MSNANPIHWSERRQLVHYSACTKFMIMGWLFGKNALITLQTCEREEVTGIVQSVQREDGSGSSFNVTINVESRSGHPARLLTRGQEVFYVKTID